MKLRLRSPEVSRISMSGFTLIQTLVYLTLFTALSGVAIVALGNTWTAAGRLRRQADDIVLLTRLGEQWRADIRAATGQPAAMQSSNATVLRIPQDNAAIVWRVDDGGVWRGQEGKPGAHRFPRVAASEMAPAARDGVHYWKWEVEVMPTHQAARLPGLFTFIAVPTAVTPRNFRQ